MLSRYRLLVRWRSILRARAVERCQYENPFHHFVFPWSVAWEVKHRLVLFVNHARSDVGQGRASRYRVGEWVRVKERQEIRATLDENDRMRGLLFTTNQWEYCGRTYQVERVVRRMLDDHYRMRSISRTVALAGAVCDSPGGSVGCGRACSLFFRDEWLEPSSVSAADPAPARRVVRVKSVGEIEATLDPRRRLDGVGFSAEMAARAGEAFRLLRPAEDTWVATPWWKKAREGWFILEGVRCTGQPLGAEGPCDRNCALLWHRSWLDMDDENSVGSDSPHEDA